MALALEKDDDNSSAERTVRTAIEVIFPMSFPPLLFAPSLLKFSINLRYAP
jgi:hypothetical protein